jgi:hypothetical protein
MPSLPDGEVVAHPVDRDRRAHPFADDRRLGGRRSDGVDRRAVGSLFSVRRRRLREMLAVAQELGRSDGRKVRGMGLESVSDGSGLAALIDAGVVRAAEATRKPRPGMYV